MNFQVIEGSFYYDSSRKLLDRVGFSVGEGDVLAILGPNGAGKTTLLKCMMGLLPWREGSTFLDGSDIKAIPFRELWKTVAYVPQAKGSVFSYSAEEMVLLGRSAHIGMVSQPSKEDRERALRAMDSIGISYLAGKSCNKMSGGELQMVLIARALAAEPRILVLDEPESNLDYKNQLVVLDVIERLAREKGICSIFNTHYPAHALRVATKSLVLDGRGTCRFGDSKSVINSENLRSCFSVNVHIDKIDLGNNVYDLVIPLNVV